MIYNTMLLFTCLCEEEINIILLDSENVYISYFGFGLISYKFTRAMAIAHLTAMSKTCVCVCVQAWYTVRQCVTAVVVASLRSSSLSVAPHPLHTYSVFVRSTLRAQTQHIRAVRISSAHTYTSLAVGLRVIA